MVNVAVISLGCDKNRIDTEHMLYRIVQAGYGISDVNEADVIIVNTCAFIESARQESIDVILSCAELKKSAKVKAIIVTGCLPQKYMGELTEELPEVDAFLGAFEYDKIVGVISNAVDGQKDVAACGDGYEFRAAENCGRLLTTYPHVAFVKVAEGCDNHCTFCAIPSIRGKYRSRTVADIVDEAAGLVKDGVKEIILVAQDVTRFGEDRGENELMQLLDGLENLPLYTIRLLYCYPERVTDDLIERIASSDKIAKYIDIPLQHYSNRILKLMNRRTDGESIERLINKLHNNGIAVRTTFMVGFPSETDDDFNELVSFVERAKIEYAGVFAYSTEDGTAAAKLPGKVTKKVMRERVKALGKACAACTRAFNASLVGNSVDVIYEDVDFDKNMFVGRARFQAPDVDGRVYFKAKTAVDVGSVYNVKITKSDDYDLYGEVTE